MQGSLLLQLLILLVVANGTAVAAKKLLSAPLFVEMAPLPSLIPPCQTADPWVFISDSPCAGQVRGDWIGVRDMRSLNQALAERNVLAGNLADRDQQST